MYPLPPSIDFALSRPPAAELRLSQDSDVERLVVADQRTMEVKSRSSDRDTGARFSPLRLSSAHAGFACFGPPGVLQDMSSEELLHTPRRKAKGSGRAPKTPTQKSRGQVKDCRTHTRDESLHVNYTVEDVERLAQEVHEETIADVHLSLFAFWIRDKEENYEMATKYIRELKLDQVSLSAR